MKKIKAFGLFEIIVIIIITALVTSVTTGIIMLNNDNIEVNGSVVNLEKDKNLQEFVNVYKMLLEKYYDNNIDKEAMLNAAEEAMVNYLGDKYTTYLTNSEYNDILTELSGTYNGIGVLIEYNKIIDVLENSPAERAGLKANDIIIKIDNVDVTNAKGEVIKELIKSNEKSINLQVSRDNNVLSFNISKEELVNPSIVSKVLDNNVGYLSISIFSENLKSQVSKALTNLENSNINSLIIDVRNNVGGYLTAAEEVASLFLEKGKKIYTLEANGNKVTYSDKTEEKREYPIIVLINGGSASASEILAAALRDSYGATLVGNKSYGKGKVQQVLSLNSGDSLKYTSAKWLTPKGTCIDGIGLTPDYNVDLEKDSATDIQLEKAIELLK